MIRDVRYLVIRPTLIRIVGGMSSDEERMIDDQLQNASDFGSDSR